MNKFRIEDEDVYECEWHTFKIGKYCLNRATKVIIEDTKARGDDYEFHTAHLCEEHIGVAYNEVIKPQQIEFCNISR